MKHLIRLAALLGLLILTGCPKPTPTSDKLLHLAFDGSTYDSAQYHYNVNANGTIRYGEDRFGNKNGAIVLNGTAKIMIPNAPKLEFSDTSSYSITAWVRTRDTSDVCIIAKGATNSEVPGYSLQLRNGRPVAIFTGASEPVQLSALTRVADNTWHLLTLAVSPDSVFLYVDTNLAASGSAKKITQKKNVKGPVAIGMQPNGQRMYRGSLDDVTIWPRMFRIRDVLSTHGPGGIIRAIAQDDMPPGVTVPYDGILDVNSVSEELAFACGTNGLLYKKDNGNAWTLLGFPEDPAPLNQSYQYDLRAISFLNQSYGAVLDENGSLFITQNGAHNWSSVVPNFGSTLSNPKIKAIHYLNGSTIIVAGSGGWPSGGHGFIGKLNPSNGSIQHLETGNVGEFIGVSVTVNNGFVRIFAFGPNGEVRKYGTGPGSGIDISPNPNELYRFQTADFVPVSSGLNAGIIGDKDGQVLRYTETNNGFTWSSPELVAPNDWIVGVRAVDGMNGELAVASGLRSSGPVASHFTRLNQTWSQVTSPPLIKTAVVWTDGVHTYAIPANEVSGNKYGLPGTIVQ